MGGTILVGAESTVTNLVRDQINMINGVLTNNLATYQAFVTDLDAQIGNFEAEIDDIGFETHPLEVDEFTVRPPGEVTLDTDFDYSGFPGPPTLEVITANVQDAPGMDIPPPTITDRGDPTITDIAFDGQEPTVDTDITIPGKPTLETLQAPESITIQIPDFDGLELPDWNVVFPEDTIPEPDTDYNYSEPAYDDTFYQSIKAWLTNVIENGGTGLGEEVLAALRANFKSWLDEDLEEEYQKILKFESSRGFTIPTGSLNARLRTFWNKRARKIQEYDNQLLSEEAKLAQQNTQFALTTGTQVEQIMREAHNQLANRMLQVAKDAVLMAIEVFKAKVEQYNAKLEAAKTQASVFESRVRAELAKVDIYKAQIEGKKLQLDAKGQEVQIYLARQQGNAQLIDMWAKEMDASKIGLENERTKIEIFKSQIEAFTARIQAERNKIDVYTALLTGDKTKAEIYSERMRGYGIEAEAIDRQNQVRIENAKLEHEVRNLGQIEILKAQIATEDAKLKAKVQAETLKVEAYKGEAQGYEAQARAYQAYTGAKADAYTAEARYAATILEKAIQEAQISQQAKLSAWAAKLDTLKARLQVTAQVVASSLSAINNSLQLGFSASTSGSITGQAWETVDTNHTHTYCEKACETTS